MSTPRIPGIPPSSEQALLAQLTRIPDLQAIWLFGSRAMERHQPGSDIDLCLDMASDQPLSHCDRLRLIAAIDDLLLPWTVDLALRQEIPAELNAHVHRVGRCLWRMETTHQDQEH
ncbi:nucleotidyltransferase domain-containing protein [Synechococcus sp. A10-1-5-9]|uniref:nucleotidyltransferase domain-containing protein n=1 Tax=Synechococcus sp. A10-1-5-9 TaxID=3392295 RepID=UPI0039E8CDC6